MILVIFEGELTALHEHESILMHARDLSVNRLIVMFERELKAHR